MVSVLRYRGNRLPSPTRVLGMGLFHIQEFFLLTTLFVYDFQPPNDVGKTLTPKDEISKAVEAYHQRKKPKIKALAREFGVPYTTLYGRIHSRKNGSQRADNNKALNQMQEKALISWLESLDAVEIYPPPNYHKSICKLAFSSLW